MNNGTGKARTIIKAIPLVILDIVGTGIAYVTAAYGTGVLGQILDVGHFAQIISVIALLNVVVFAIGHLYNPLWEYASVDKLVRVVVVVTVASMVSDIISALIFGHRLPFYAYGVAWLVLLVVCGASRFAIRMYSGRKGWSMLHKPEVVFHAAAHKHAPLMERNAHVEQVIIRHNFGSCLLNTIKAQLDNGFKLVLNKTKCAFGRKGRDSIVFAASVMVAA